MGPTLASITSIMINSRIIVCASLVINFSIAASASAKTPDHIDESIIQGATLDSIEESSRDLAQKTELEAQKAYTRWKHAKELLGKSYQKSVVKSGEDIASLDEVLSQWTKKALRGSWKKWSRDVTKAILREAERYRFDPIFLMAVIQSESSFNPEVIGTSGEVGLMQITPQTGEWITKKYDLPWKGTKSLKNPVTNIKIGAAYMAYLREKFDFHSQLYLAAYNMGSANVQRALDRQIYPKEYSSRVIHNYIRFYSELQNEIKKNID
jgi:soluble lytic murein transglycosylase